jgi:gliding motility-associated-like protein
MRFLSFLLLAMLSCLASQAEIFTVTNNSNAGAGSLRQAILDANLNGIVLPDRIHFELPGISVADVTIIITEELPALTSNLVLDGTMQPTALLGSQSIRIRLVRGAAAWFNGLILDGVSNIEIYGIYFSNFLSQPSAPSDERKAGIFLRNTSHVKIGAPNKQNGFGNNYTSIISPTTPNLQEDITISSNIIGLDPSGMTAAGNVVGIDLSYLRNSTIGGPGALYGNLISSNTDGVSLGALSGTVNFSFNVIGFNIDKSRTFPADQSIGVFANGQGVDLLIADNYIVVQFIGIKIDNVRNSFSIERNVIGAGPNSENYGNGKYGIELYNCGAGTIGYQNTIAYNDEAVKVDLSYPVSILKNSIYCNNESIVFDRLPEAITPSTISSITSTSASGVYLPNSFIELFYDDECPDCQGKVWIATIPTNADGSWVYNGTLTGGITSAGTNADGATSSFSKPLLFDQGKKITETFCGSSTGSIKDVEVTDASFYNWYTEGGSPAGNEKDLVGVVAGKYYLKAGQPGGCTITSPTYTITNKNIVFKAKNFVVVPANCNSDNGSITITGYETEEPSFFEWKDEAGTVVGHNALLTDQPAGKYTLTASNGQDCSNIAGEFVVPEVIKPSIDLSGLIKSSTCDGRFISGTGIKIDGATGPYSYVWANEQGGVVGNELALKKAVPGKYYLTVTDRYNCVQMSPLMDFTDIGRKALVVPNSISPNGDGINDTWKIQGAESYTSADFSVFNRYGERVFYSRGYTLEFDGSVKDRHLPAGVYYYVIDLNGDCPNLTGSLTIIK